MVDSNLHNPEQAEEGPNVYLQQYIILTITPSILQGTRTLQGFCISHEVRGNILPVRASFSSVSLFLLLTSSIQLSFVESVNERDVWPRPDLLAAIRDPFARRSLSEIIADMLSWCYPIFIDIEALASITKQVSSSAPPAPTQAFSKEPSTTLHSQVSTYLPPANRYILICFRRRQ